MSKTFDQGKDEVARLCRYFANNRQAFLAPGVKEAHIRQSLIDPFFEALGWDMRNAAMAAPQYREVITEDSLDVEGQQKAPDYTFRVGEPPGPGLDFRLLLKISYRRSVSRFRKSSSLLFQQNHLF
jgi:hypothetical protein